MTFLHRFLEGQANLQELRCRNTGDLFAHAREAQAKIAQEHARQAAIYASHWIVYDADGSYYALAQNERLRDFYLREIMMQTHREGRAESYSDAVKRGKR